MVMSQQDNNTKALHIPLEKENLIRTTHTIDCTMDNRKKKRKNLLKAWEIKENLNKQFIKPNETRETKSHQSDKEIVNNKEFDLLSDFRGENDEEHDEENVYNSPAAIIDFDEQFWSCGVNEEQQRKTSKENGDKRKSDKSAGDKSVTDKTVSDNAVNEQCISDNSVSGEGVRVKSVCDRSVKNKSEKNEKETIENENHGSNKAENNKIKNSDGKSEEAKLEIAKNYSEKSASEKCACDSGKGISSKNKIESMPESSTLLSKMSNGDCSLDIDEKAGNIPLAVNGYEVSRKCCDFCASDNNSLSLTLQLCQQDHSDSSSFADLEDHDKIKNDFLKGETEVQVSTELILENSNNEACGGSQMDYASLAASKNCVCLAAANAGHHQVLSIVENGFVINHKNSDVKDAAASNQQQDGGQAERERQQLCLVDNPQDDSEAVILEDLDLPNYSRSCVYEERIIDFENFRIIEQVIDNNCEGKHTMANPEKCCHVKECNMNTNMPFEDPKEGTEFTNQETSKVMALKKEMPKEMPSSSKSLQNSAPIYMNPALNFSCSELVAFIGESYKVLDNAQAVFSTDKIRNAHRAMPVKVKECSSLGSSPLKRGKRANNEMNSTTLQRCVDDNNNTRRYAGITAAERLMQSLNCDVSKELTLTKRAAKRDIQPKSKAGNQSNKTSSATTKTLLKALKSKLTPLAPPFQPSTSTNKTISNEVKVGVNATTSTYNTATLVNYGQTIIYYQQQQQQQQHHQQPQQQQPLQPSPQVVNSYQQQLLQQLQQQQLTLSQLPTQQQQQPQQQLYVVQPANPHLQFAPVPQQNLTPNSGHQHHHHQHHCAQNILAMSSGQGVPHIHLPTPAAAANAPTTNNGHLSNATATAGTALINVVTANPVAHQQHHHHHLLPIHLLTAVGGATGAATNTWPFVEASNANVNANAATTAPIYVDINGELRSICPAHGPPPTAVAITNSTAVANPAIMQQQQPPPATQQVCLSPLQYPTLNLSAQYNSPQQQQQHFQQHQHANSHHYPQPHHPHQHQQLQQQQQQQLQPSLANSQNSPLRLKTTASLNATTCPTATNLPISISSTNSSAAASATAPSAPPASATPPRVVLQLDAGVSLPLQIAGKRKIFREDVCQARWKSLRDKYVKKIAESYRASGSGADVDEPQWLYQQQMEFLREHIQPRRTLTSISSEFCEIIESTPTSPLEDIQYQSVENLTESPLFEYCEEQPSTSTPISSDSNSVPSEASNSRRKRARRECETEAFTEFLNNMTAIAKTRFAVPASNASQHDGFFSMVREIFNELPSNVVSEAKFFFLNYLRDQVAATKKD